MKNIYTLKDLTNQELRELVSKCCNELEERKKAEKEELIEAFKVAFCNLNNAGIEVIIDCDCCGEEIPFTFDNLYFD